MYIRVYYYQVNRAAAVYITCKYVHMYEYDLRHGQGSRLPIAALQLLLSTHHMYVVSHMRDSTTDPCPTTVVVNVMDEVKRVQQYIAYFTERANISYTSKYMYIEREGAISQILPPALLLLPFAAAAEFELTAAAVTE